MTSENELMYMMSLSLVSGIGTERGKNLIDRFGSAEKVFAASKSSLASTPGIGETLASAIKDFKDFHKAEKEWAFTQKYHIQILDLFHPNYPNRLRNQFDPPLILFQKGTTLLKSQRLVGIIGTRKCSEYGKAMARKLAADLSAFGCIVVSGLAYGIDAAAHDECNKHGMPNVAVLGHGLDNLYPRSHHKLAKELLSCGGSLLTEYFTNVRMVPEMFPRRNRIVAGMCDAIVIVESAMKGGAMVTIDIADSYNTDLFAIPGRIGDSTAEGPHFLIRKNKAALITSAEDLIEAMNWNQPATKPAQIPLITDLSNDERVILRLFDSQKLHIDQIQAASLLPASALNFALLNLEMNGCIRSLPGKFFEKC